MTDEKKTGWIKLSRKMIDDSVYLYQKFTDGQAWIDLIFLAAFKDGQINVSGKRIEIKRGQVGYSQKSLARRWSWSRGKVKRFLNFLENEHRIEQVNEQLDKRLKTIISITNYHDYQFNEQVNGQVNEQLTDNSRTSNGTVYKNDKNEKNEKKNNSALSPKGKKRQKAVRDNPPTLDETLVYCDGQRFDPNFIDPIDLWNFYVTDKDESEQWTYKDGKKIKNWKSMYTKIHNSNKREGKTVKGYVKDTTQSTNPLPNIPQEVIDNRHPDDPNWQHREIGEAKVEEVVTSPKGVVFIRKQEDWYSGRIWIREAWYNPNSEDFEEDYRCITEAEIRRHKNE